MVLAQYALEKRIEKPNDRAAGKRKITNSGASATYDNAQPHLRWSRIHTGGSVDEIKKCPFCGSEPRIISWKKGKCRHVIGCKNETCFIWLPNNIKWKERMNYSGGVWVDKTKMIEEWNRRAE